MLSRGRRRRMIEEKQEKKVINTAKLVREQMSDRDFELYLYSLKKLAEKNLDDNLTYMTCLLYTSPSPRD